MLVKKKTNGVSLLVLIITILVIIILAAAVMLSLANNNPIENANEAKIKTDMGALKDEWSMFYLEDAVNTVSVPKEYDLNRMNIDKDGNILYNGKIVSEGNEEYVGFADIMPSIIGTEYEGKVFIADGEIYIDNRDNFLNSDKQKWVKESGVKLLNEGVVLVVSENEVNLKNNASKSIYATVLPDINTKVEFSMPENNSVRLFKSATNAVEVQGITSGRAVLKVRRKNRKKYSCKSRCRYK